MKVIMIVAVALMLAGCGHGGDYGPHERFLAKGNAACVALPLVPVPTWFVDLYGQVEADAITGFERCGLCAYITDQYGIVHATCTDIPK